MTEEVKKRYEHWLNDPYFDQQTKDELKAIRGDEEEINDRFYRDLEFGTGGLRGVLGAGTNRMNVYTVRKATQGLANYIKKQHGEDKGVAIAFDSRIMSKEFANEAALCLNANGIKSYIFPSLRPTPLLSFTVRYLHCIAGIVITASHNPREYNGYKVYWEDGAQITPPHDKNIMAEVADVKDFSDVVTMDEESARVADLYHVIGYEVDDAYISELKKQSVHPEVIREMSNDFTIVYTPLHGTGNVFVRRVLKELGFNKVYTVPEQEKPDGNFPTVSYPNPESPKAFELALKLAEEKDADLVLATDPDADRLGVYCRDMVNGGYISFTGNMSGVLIGEYLLREKKATGTLPKDAAVVETIVTTDMLKAIAADYNVSLIEVLTGFKYIGEQIKLFKKNSSHEFVFGMEESYGCLAGTYARDKDAPVAVMLLCEAACWYKKHGKTLWDAMEDLYKKYGYYRETLSTITKKGEDGASAIKAMMDKMRNEHVECIGDYKVLALRDYKTGLRRDYSTGEETPVTLPVSDVLYYELSDNAWCCVRPSGTEPKIKFYMGVRGSSLSDADKRLSKLKDAMLKLGED
ncbi:MAG: phospho-sugar mutase [Lachnospiraceae bacterium]|uniref:Phosphoglucomutase n=1 Tax=Candidatus Weimeria bifida TaxID=2599074 RepID=A0A6N7J0K8_9FIRM|nr:phospho-sugar mutase [Candidatus Weimeria bifida]RRF95115.1 MAG: phospho-sugar mutase [Lachnospiraceae bacterium]